MLDFRFWILDWTTPVRRAFVIILALMSAAPAFAQGSWWNSGWKCRRTLKADIPAGVEADEPAAVARFMTHGYLTPDARDLRIVAKGREVPSRVLAVGPGDEVTVAFQLVAGTDSYHAYYGNPKADPPKYGWDLRAGVLLEVKRYPGGPAATLAQVRALWERAGPVMGADVLPRIFEGVNPFGSSDAFMSRYTAWLRVDRPGNYEFYMNSSGTGHLLLDGEDLVGRTRVRPRVNRRPHYVGGVDLKPGRYKLEFYHVHPWGDMPVAVVAWQPPGADGPEVITAGQFLPVARALVQPAQVADQALTPDFEFRHVDASLDPSRDTWVSRFEFRDVTGNLDRKYWRAQWDFGDGITSAVWMPGHVYLAPGTYTVTYTLRGLRETIVTRQRLAVSRNWAEQANPAALVNLEDLYGVVKGYDFAAMPPESLAGACEMFERLRRDDDLVRVARILLFGTKAISDATLASESDRLASVYLDRVRDVKLAAEVYLNGEKRAASADAKARLAVSAARVLVEAGDADRSREACRRALEYKPAKSDIRRRAIMGLAEAAILKHDAKEAEARLGEAAVIPVNRAELGGEAVRVGSLSRAVEDYIRRSEFIDARDLLDAWEWEYPLDRLAGYSTLLRARLCQSRGELDRAAALLTSLVAVNPRSNYAAEALMDAAGCLAKLGDKPRAVATYKRIPAEYPESPFVKDALKQLEALK